MPSVLSVQSHVVHGYVGNRAATFPLQYQGWDVDAFNTVHFSNHTGYGSTAGTKTSVDELENIYAKLKEFDVVYDAFLTGYTPSAEAVKAVGEIGVNLKERFPNLIWQLDPVMGDEGKLYVSEAVIPIYQSILKTGKVTLITPNGFEAETLTGIKMNTKHDIKKVVEVLHSEFKVPHVVITSVVIDGALLTVGSSQGETPFYYQQEQIKSYFTGTGDLFASLILNNFYHTRSLKETIGKSLFVTRQILQETYEYSKQHMSEGATRGQWKKMRHLELRVIPNRKVLDVNGSYGQAIPL